MNYGERRKIKRQTEEGRVMQRNTRQIHTCLATTRLQSLLKKKKKKSQDHCKDRFDPQPYLDNGKDDS